MDRQATTFDIPDMQCQGCAERIERIERMLTRRSGVRSTEVRLGDKQASVTYDADTTDPEALRAAIERAGYTPQLA